MMKYNRHIYVLFQGRNTINDDYVKYFDAYIKVVKSYGGKTPIHRGLVKTKITKTRVQNTNNPTLERN